jgi:hypothetical protein
VWGEYPAKNQAEIEELMRWKTFGANFYSILEAFCGGSGGFQLGLKICNRQANEKKTTGKYTNLNMINLN